MIEKSANVAITLTFMMGTFVGILLTGIYQMWREDVEKRKEKNKQNAFSREDRIKEDCLEGAENMMRLHEKNLHAIQYIPRTKKETK